MKRVIKFVKQNIVGFILGIMIIGIGFVTAANLVPATRVAYNNSNSEATTVNEALYDFYDKCLTNTDTANSSIIDLGEFTHGNNENYENISIPIYPLDSIIVCESEDISQNAWAYMTG